MKQICFIISDIDKALPFEWQALGLSENYDLHYILLRKGPSAFESFLHEEKLPYQRIETSNYLMLWVLLYRALTKMNPDAVHCHLRKAEIGGMVAAWLAGIKNRIYTRHSSTYNHLFHKKGVWVDKWINRFSTSVVSISENVSEVLLKKEKVSPSKIVLLPHGFKLDSFREVPENRVMAVRERYSIPDQAFVVGVIARYTKWKGFESLIPALHKFQQEHPDTFFIFANATGNDKQWVQKLLTENLKMEYVREIIHEKDIAALYHLLSVYIHVPFDDSVEAFGQTYVEALASGIPGIFTLSGIAKEFISHEYNALVVPFKDSEAIANAINRIKIDRQLCDKLVKNGYSSVKRFDWDDYLSNLKIFYENQLNG